MDLSSDKVTLRPLSLGCRDADAPDFLVVQQAWGELLYRSVEAISSSLAGVEDFAEECIYSGTILAKSPRDDGVTRRYRAHIDQNQQPAIQPTEPSPSSPLPVGIIYLKASALPGTFDIGLAIAPDQRGNGWGPEAVRVLVKWAFEELRCHRIQARVVESNAQWRSIAMSVFMRLGFSLEGTSRRAIFCPTHPMDPYPDGTNGEWRDVTHLSILDVDWVMYSVNYNHPPSLIKRRWEELFAREEIERTELLRFEEEEERRRRAGLKSSSSRETLRTMHKFSNNSPTLSSYALYPPYPFVTGEPTLDKGKEVDPFASEDDFKFPQDIEATLYQSLIPCHGKVKDEQEEQWYTSCSSEITNPASSSNINMAEPYGRPDSGSPSSSRSFIPSSIPREPRLRSVSPASSSYTALTFAADDDDDLYSDFESVPSRSPSVVSDVSSVQSSIVSGEWDLMDSASEGSSHPAMHDDTA